MGFSTPQEEFWAGKFGSDYIERNKSDELVAANIGLFARATASCGRIVSCIEFGANIGLNLAALRALHPKCELEAIEINPDAARALRTELGDEHVFEMSLLEFEPRRTWDLVLTKGVLIHQNPNHLPKVYDALFQSAERFILLAEYYNPAPVSIPYRGHEDRLFKRDFAGEMLDRFETLRLRDYGFAYRRDPVFPQDDLTWFLLEKVAL